MASLTINTTSLGTLSNSDKDLNRPYSYQDWKLRNSGIPFNEAFNLYYVYLKNWYVRKGLTNVVSINYVKEYYKAYLQLLGVTPRTVEEQELFTNVNIDNDLSLQSVIAGYARRLKDISVYLATRRNLVSYSKLKASLVGTNTSLERLFYSYILSAFTRKITPDGIITTSFTITNPAILNSLPYLSVISSSFNVEIEELYDTSNYFDRDPSADINTYTNILSGIPEALYSAGSYDIPEDYVIASTLGAVITTGISGLISTGSITGLPTYFTFIGDGNTTTYSLTDITSNTASDYQVSIDGVVQAPDSNYTVSTINQSITFVEAPPVNTVIVIVIRY